VLVGERRNLRAKLLLTRGCADDVLREPVAEAGEPAAESRALVALAAAATGDVKRARADAEAAIGDAQLIEARAYGRFALLISDLVEHGTTPEVEADALALLRATVDAEMLDACVLAYRAFPPLLGVLGARPEGLGLVQGLAVRAHDLHLARRAGIAGAERQPLGLEVLTPREQEVLALMAEGLGNRAIARRLFITEKTAKVHVGHIFDKLGVESRVQAVLVAQQLATLIS